MDMKKNVLVICPNEWDNYYLNKQNKSYNFHYLHKKELMTLLCEQEESVMKKCLQYFNISHFHAAVSTDESLGILFAAWICQQINCPSPNSELILQLQNKFCSRKLQESSVKEVVPEYEFISVDKPSFPEMKMPVFIKPTKGVFSCLTSRILNEADFKQYFNEAIDTYKEKLTTYNRIKKALNLNLEQEEGFLCESLLHGKQYTLEGYATSNVVEVLGVVDSVMYPNTDAFHAFEYPSRLPAAIQDQFSSISKKIMNKIGFTNGFFNVEFFYSESQNEIFIIEINPRMSSVFSDLFFKVNAVSSHDILMSLVDSDKKIPESSKGKHLVSAAIILRRFKDGKVKSVPCLNLVSALEKKYDMRIQIYVQIGDILSQKFTRQPNYKYAVIHLGASSWADLYNIYAMVEKKLDFQFG